MPSVDNEESKKPKRPQLPRLHVIAKESQPESEIEEYEERLVNLQTEVVMRFEGRDYTISGDSFEGVKYISHGCYGTVSHFKHKESGFNVAIKCIDINPERTDSADALNDWRKRGHMDVTVNQRIISQPNEETCQYIIRPFGVFRKEDQMWICMELMDITLDGFYKTVYNKMGEQLPEHVIASIVYAVISGLSFLKKRLKIMHRDIKPSNILLNRNGDVKISDFGISGELDSSLTKTNIGCKYYKAPERLDGDASSDCREKGFGVRSDVWSLGITAMEIATGKLPFKDTSLMGFRKCLPTLPGDSPYSPEFRTFCEACCQEHHLHRPDYDGLLQMAFVAKEAADRHNIAVDVQRVLEYDN